MKYLKLTLLALLEVLIVRELIGLYEWFVVDGKSWSDLKKLTKKDVKDQLDDELKHPVRHYGRIFRKAV